MRKTLTSDRGEQLLDFVEAGQVIWTEVKYGYLNHINLIYREIT